MSESKIEAQSVLAPAAEPSLETPSSTSTSAVAATSTTASTAAPPSALTSSQKKKVKVCIYFGYVGEHYCGLQYVKEDRINTVERELLRAFWGAGLVTTANFESDAPMQKIAWERASRTDKGVHALKNLISAKLQFEASEVDAGDFGPTVERINALLPADVRVFKIQPVTGSFNAYMMCHGRRYQYYLPTYALCSKADYDAMMPHSVAPQHIVDEDVLDERDRPIAPAKKAAEGTAEGHGEEANEEGSERREMAGEKRPRADSEGRTAGGANGESDSAPPQAPHRVNPDIKYGAEPMKIFKSVPAENMRQLAAYRITTENLQRTRELFAMYVGTKSYHNFTPGGKASDPSTTRYIQKVTVTDPEIFTPAVPEGCSEAEAAALAAHFADVYPNGLEWVRIEIEGQSFMLNQIRKMVGNVICTMIQGLPDFFVSDALQPNVIRGIPMAPANGLFLSYLNFSIYNKKLEKMKAESGAAPGVVAPGKLHVDMDFEELPVDPALEAANPPQYAALVAERESTRAAVAAMHKRILATVGRKECSEDITGRWVRSSRHVCRLAFRMEFGPEDDPMRYEKAPAPIAIRTTMKTMRVEAEAKAADGAVTNTENAPPAESSVAANPSE